MSKSAAILDPSIRASLDHLVTELLRWNQKINLTGHRDEKSVEVDLIQDSLALAGHIQGETVLDIGSGAGFPGLVLALARPELQVTLLEPRGKRVSFQEHIIRTLDLKDRVEAIQGRASLDRKEDPPTLRDCFFSTVTLKAVTSLEESLALAKPYLAPGGRIVLPRGSSDRQAALDMGLEVVDYQLPEPGGKRILAISS
jgi:16S rRNA (guanine527-N7)-methyltransferase